MYGILAFCKLPCLQTFSRSISRQSRIKQQIIYRRQRVESPPESVHRSFFPNWNYSAEIVAFTHRFGIKNINIDHLQRAFVEPKYVSVELERRRGSSKDPTLPIKDHSQLIEDGKTIFGNYLNRLIQDHYPNFPNFLIKSAFNYLTQPLKLREICLKLGLEDLILSPSYPFSNELVCDALYSLITVINEYDSSICMNFVRDYFFSQIVGVDLVDSICVEDPKSILSDLLPLSCSIDSRLVYANSIASVRESFHIAVYVDGNFRGEGFDEDIYKAEHNAFVSAIKATLCCNKNNIL